ncbi:16S rRNA (guanine(527)-N(7))-methyltransferase RsmG [Sphingomonas tabacisoli]|uniref:Ribosomal RNA small subunit methyltransferase G n=1 Tax=Sphingomonas tabacisoli TaxID=2249466 RepID=A0ABW4HX29_9SPHN
MTEEESRDWIAERYGAEKLGLLDRYVELLLTANRTQNLISKATEPQIWARHILDSAQLLRFAPEARSWLDVGSGPGLPGIVIAILADVPTMLVEPRRKRVEFLADVAHRLGLAHIRIRQAAIAQVRGEKFAAVTARAYAALPEILLSTHQLTTSSTIWVLPKGRSAQAELDEARQAWQGVFHVEQSLTDNDSHIIVATDVRPR